MSLPLDTSSGATMARIKDEIADSFDEELEMEIDESRLEDMLLEMEEHPDREQVERRVYFRELFRLQHELVRLQDWVVHKGLKVVVIFEGRDSAGKGGAIKRITQRLNPCYNYSSGGDSACWSGLTIAHYGTSFEAKDGASF